MVTFTKTGNSVEMDLGTDVHYLPTSMVVSAKVSSNKIFLADLDATIAAFANMEIDIVVTGAGLNVGNVAQAVWGALASDHNDSGTMGNKLNSAASGGVDYGALADAVWDEDVSDHTTAGTMGKKLKDSLKKGDFIALK